MRQSRRVFDSTARNFERAQHFFVDSPGVRPRERPRAGDAEKEASGRRFHPS